MKKVYFQILTFFSILILVSCSLSPSETEPETVLPSTPQMNLQYITFNPTFLTMKEKESQCSVSFATYPENASLAGLEFVVSDGDVLDIEWDGASSKFNIIRKNFDRFNSINISGQVNGITLGNIVIQFESPEVGIPGIISFTVQDVELGNVNSQKRISFYGPSNEYYRKYLVFSSADENIAKVEWDGQSDFITITKNTSTTEGETEIYADFTGGIPYKRTTLKVRLCDDEIFQIKNEDDLFEWKEALDANNSINAELVNNIRLSRSWTPIEAFYGVLDGNGYKISNLAVSEIINTNYGACSGFIGLLGRGGIIRNLNIDGNVTINTDASVTVGGLVGYANEAEISNCGFDGNLTVSLTAYGSSVGGLVGYIKGATIVKQARTTGNIDSSSSSYVGGIVGDGSGDLQNCESWMHISILGGASIGGVAGRFDDGSMHDVHFHGIINSDSGAGGLVGSFADGILEDSSFDGELFFQNLLANDNIGGCAASSSGIITNCTSDGTIVGTLKDGARNLIGIGGFVGNLTNGRIDNCTSTTVIDISSETNSVNGQINIGGFVGLRYNYLPSEFLIEKCSYEGKISINGKLTFNLIIGGFGGFLMCYPGYIIACTSNAEILIDGQDMSSEDSRVFAGEFIGQNLCAPFVACSSSGRINIVNVESYAQFVGGLVGFADNAYGDVYFAEVPTEIWASYSIVDFDINFDAKRLSAGAIAGQIDDVNVKSSFWNSENKEINAYGLYDDETSFDGVHEVIDNRNWIEAIDEMNSAIETWNTEHLDYQCRYKFHLGGEGLPELR